MRKFLILVALMLAIMPNCKGGEQMILASPAFQDRGVFPVKYTIDGDKVSPPLKWTNPPQGTKSFALIMDDLDVPKELGGRFIHWMVYDIPANTRGFDEGKIPVGAKTLPNDYAKFGVPELAQYGPPWPPTPNHRYRFTIYALKVDKLTIDPKATYEQFMAAIQANIIFEAGLLGIYGPAKMPLPK